MQRCQPLTTLDKGATIRDEVLQHLQDRQDYGVCMKLHNDLVQMIEDRLVK